MSDTPKKDDSIFNQLQDIDTQKIKKLTAIDTTKINALTAIDTTKFYTSTADDSFTTDLAEQLTPILGEH